MNKLLTSFLILSLTFSSTLYADIFKPYKANNTPPLSLTDLAGNSHTLEQYKGKIIMVQFWATYCTPCRTEMPSMNRLMKKMGDDLVILAIDMGEPKNQVLKFVDEVKPEFTILLDENGQATGEWKVFAAPSTFILDRSGQAHYTVFGGVEWDSKEIIQKLKAL